MPKTVQDIETQLAQFLESAGLDLLPMTVDSYQPETFDGTIPAWSTNTDRRAVAARRAGIDHIADNLVEVCCQLEIVEIGLRQAEVTSELAAAQRKLIRSTLAILEHVVLTAMNQTARRE